MLPNNVVHSTHQLIRAAADCAWAQWSSVGAMTHRRPTSSNEIVDIEALLLASLNLSSREPRLRTHAFAWAINNSDLICIARLRAMLRGPLGKAEGPIRELAQLLTPVDPRWASIVARKTPSAKASASKHPDAGKAVTPRWLSSGSLMLRLRRAMGVGVRADVLTILLGRGGDWVDVASLAELSRYTSAAVRRAADNMADAGFIESTHDRGKTFRANPSSWGPLLGSAEYPHWRRRADGFEFVAAWNDNLEGANPATANAFSLALTFSARMTDYWLMWNEAGVTQEPVSEDPARAWDSRAAAIEALCRWFGAP